VRAPPASVSSSSFLTRSLVVEAATALSLWAGVRSEAGRPRSLRRLGRVGRAPRHLGRVL